MFVRRPIPTWTRLAGDLAAGARGGNELALKSELPTVNPTNLSVTRDATEVTVASSTGTDAAISAASTTEAGVLTAADKAKVNNAVAAAATINSGSVVTSAGGRNVRAATDSDLDSLAGDLASGDRGGNELALKSELASVGGNTRGALIATTSTFPTAATHGEISISWTLESGIPSGFSTSTRYLEVPYLKPADDVDGFWAVSLVDGTEIRRNQDVLGWVWYRGGIRGHR